VSFRTPLDYLTDALADEREKTIPSDVLMHLTDHPNNIVKDFERKFTRKFLQAKALQTREESYEGHPRGPDGLEMRLYTETHYDTVYPEFPFDDEPITFDPNDLLAFLEALETLFFHVMQLEGNLQEEYSNVVSKWGFACSGMFYPTKNGLKNNLDKLNIYPEMIEKREQRCKTRYERFSSNLLHVIKILAHEPIYVYPSTLPYENTSQQTHADRKAEIANQLTHLPIGNAKVRVSKWDKDARKVVMVEHTIRTITPDTPKALLSQASDIRMKYLEQTRHVYCRPRAEVEEEIRARTQSPAPPTTRTHQVY
jgi:hypothetical protein